MREIWSRGDKEWRVIFLTACCNPVLPEIWKVSWLSANVGHEFILTAFPHFQNRILFSTCQSRFLLLNSATKILVFVLIATECQNFFATIWVVDFVAQGFFLNWYSPSFMQTEASLPHSQRPPLAPTLNFFPCPQTLFLWKSVLILSFLLLLDFPSRLLLLGFPITDVCAFIVSPKYCVFCAPLFFIWSSGKHSTRSANYRFSRQTAFLLNITFRSEYSP